MSHIDQPWRSAPGVYVPVPQRVQYPPRRARPQAEASWRACGLRDRGLVWRLDRSRPSQAPGSGRLCACS